MSQTRRKDSPIPQDTRMRAIHREGVKYLTMRLCVNMILSCASLHGQIRGKFKDHVGTELQPHGHGALEPFSHEKDGHYQQVSISFELELLDHGMTGDIIVECARVSQIGAIQVISTRSKLRDSASFGGLTTDKLSVSLFTKSHMTRTKNDPRQDMDVNLSRDFFVEFPVIFILNHGSNLDIVSEAFLCHVVGHDGLDGLVWGAGRRFAWHALYTSGPAQYRL